MSRNEVLVQEIIMESIGLKIVVINVKENIRRKRDKLRIFFFDLYRLQFQCGKLFLVIVFGNRLKERRILERDRLVGYKLFRGREKGEEQKRMIKAQ